MRCINCGLMGHIAKECRGKGKVKGEGKDGGKGYTKGKRMADNGRQDGLKFGGYKGGAAGSPRAEGYQGRCWTCGNLGHKSSECRWGVAGVVEEDADCRKSGCQPASEEDGEVGSAGIVGNVEELEEEEDGTGRLGAIQVLSKMCGRQCFAFGEIRAGQAERNGTHARAGRESGRSEFDALASI